MQPNDTASNDPSAVPTVTVPAALFNRAASAVASLTALMERFASEGPEAVTSIFEVQRIARGACNDTARELVDELRSVASK
jgi:hypothetical protein